jgi:magnesium chelatase family protein
MALARTASVSLVGLEAHVVTVEADIASGLPAVIWTGLSDQATRQSGARISRAVTNSREVWPSTKITIGLSPASLHKSGSAFDLPVATAILAAAGAIDPSSVRDAVILGELRLDGQVQPVTGVLPSVIGALRSGRSRFVVPRANAGEARLVPGAEVMAVSSLAELCARLRGEFVGDLEEEPVLEAPEQRPVPDFADVIGQQAARWAMEVSAAGGHHVYLKGPPGVGKTMLAERMPGLLPDLGPEEALDVTSIHSLLGRLAPGAPLVTRPPFCAPHHTATVPSLVGGGSGIAGPGAISLAHRGVLFLDEAPEFSNHALDALRQPLEAGPVTITRARGVATYPARFLLLLAANPCPCGRGGTAGDTATCSCSPARKRSYTGRLSGPMDDRIDLRAELLPVSRAVLLAGAAGEPTSAIRARVELARDRAAVRMRGTPWRTNGEIDGPSLRREWPVPAHAMSQLHRDLDRGMLSTRGVDRVLKVAWTVADLAGHDRPDADDVAAARALRFGGQPLLRTVRGDTGDGDTADEGAVAEDTLAVRVAR